MRSFPSARGHVALLASTLVLATALLLASLTPSFARPADIEPPQAFLLHVGDQAVPVSLDRDFVVEIGDQPVRMRLTAAPDRLFDNANGVRFRYPATMSFEFDGTSPGVRSWTLDGNDCVVMLLHFEEPGMGAREVLGNLLGDLRSQFGRANTQVTDHSLVLGGRTVKGSRLTTTLAGMPLRQDVVTFGHGTAVYALIVQDSLDDADATTAEAAGVLRLLASSFKFPE